MTMQPRPTNPIELRKQQVREHVRAIAISTPIALVSLVILGFVSTSMLFMITFLVATAVGAVNAVKLRRVINHKDQY
ncbi:hypothetical protein [Corynebacterium sp. HS2168-gen11]|uniref:hypothetical protein n=1 Tax=Corynebacterium sp. HS2168-gen11 TaxID=2974027 RepID=UPI00216B2303|nr:hypothetical protein [Corynebacterium sp. HS2168-gen11]MCS4536226.1 hypothetical protein [Corynebacterium sp. HS2168-gen11]